MRSALPLSFVTKLRRNINWHIDNHVACVELKTNSGPLILCSGYLRPSLSDFLSSVKEIFDSYDNNNTVYGFDANARNPLWNSARAGSRGKDLEMLSFNSKLTVANAPCETLDFVPTGTSFVDVTLRGDQIAKWLFGWS